ncbi:MAG: DNA/RNA nuclease SfsA [Rhodospirillales bacterium]|nr:DNA/RNA nuclease SfsA [Rhodospirillales bacterium]MDE0380771.1 DNA/RNA nuclease SfsA [Rhodospirillales bacterium]
MRFPLPLRRATLLKRYKRFMSDHRLDDGGTVTAHVANPGAMTGLVDAGLETWLSPAANPKRKLPFSWEMVRIGEGLVGVNASRPNALAREAIEAGTIPPLAGYDTIRREVAYGERSRVDFLLEAPDRPPCYVEVKNVHLKRGPAAEFPDSVTARGTKHLRELAAVAGQGARAVMLYIVQREDCDAFALAADIDPAYAVAFAQARAGGVEALAYACRLAPDGIVVDQPLPIEDAD